MPVELKVGDSVKLKSGSPAMTVNKVNGETVQLVWHSACKDEFSYQVFNPEALKKVDDDARS